MTTAAAKRALITGAAGFVGKTLTHYLRSQQWDVLGCDALPANDPAITQCDMADRDAVAKAVAWAGPITHVFHLAAIAFIPDAQKNPARSFEVNLLGTIHLADALQKQLPSARLIFVGSADAYGRPETLPISEDHPLRPVNPYAITKAAADQYCAFLHTASGLDILRVRPFNHSGPGQSDAFVLSSFAHQIASIEAGKAAPVLRVGNLEAARDFSHVNDVVRAYEAIALKGTSGDVYNVCSGSSVSIRAALDHLVSLSTVPITVEIDPDRMRPADVPEMRGTARKLHAVTGWQPQVPFEQILADLLGYWRKMEAC